MTTMARARVVVADDEPLARDGLVRSIGRLVAERAIEPIDVVAACHDGASTERAIREHRPDVLIVDIAMPNRTGLEVLEQLEPEATPPAIIFLTAYDEHALRAFGVRALDYLVKPVPESRLAESLRRALTRVAEVRALAAELERGEDLAAPPKEPGRYLRQLVVPDRGARVVIPVDDIEWIEGETYYVRIHRAGDRSRLLRERMSVLERALDPSEFFRSHRSAIVRLSRVRAIRAETPHSWTVAMSNGDTAPLSRDKHRQLEELLRS